MPIVQAGSLNTTALVVPDLYVQIVPPQNLVLNGVPSNRIGVVGTATWGPVGVPVIVGSMQQYAQAFGPLMARKFDMGTQVAVAVQQGAQDFRCVRVTDGTDVAASVEIESTCIDVTSLYSGTLGNLITVSIGPGSKANTFRAVIGMPGLVPEVFDNLAGSGNAVWLAMAAAINGGQGIQRGPSQLVTATAGVGTTAPATATYTLAAGTDGATTITAAILVGVDTGAASKGMYALRSTGCAIGVLADADDSTQWTSQVSYGLSEGTYMILTGPAGDTVSNAVTAKATAAIDSYAAKLMFGDWLWWSDTTNNVQRLVSPQGFIAGRMGNSGPQFSTLNQQLYNIIGSQKSGQVGTAQSKQYTSADLTALFQAGIDVITNPIPAGHMWGARGGLNTSSNSGTNGDNYTRMTNFIAATLNAGMGLFVGQLITAQEFINIRSTILSFLQAMLGQGLLGSTTGSLPFSVVCDTSNNPQPRTALGYVQADVQVQYQGITKFFLVNLEGGQTVTVNVQTTPSGQV